MQQSGRTRPARGLRMIMTQGHVTPMAGQPIKERTSQTSMQIIYLYVSMRRSLWQSLHLKGGSSNGSGSSNRWQQRLATATRAALRARDV